MNRKVIRKSIAGLVMLSLMAILTTPALGDNLWVVPENPTGYSETGENFVLQEVVIEEILMGTSLTGSILILYQAGDNEEAQDVNIKFYVHDASNIKNITIGTAQRIEPGNPPYPNITDPNPGSNPAEEILYFDDVPENPPVPKGFGVEYLVGDIPWSGGPSITGNPEDSDFNPGNARCYVRVPFTIYFNDIPDIGFALYVYAENYLDGKDRVKTVYSHDGTFYHTPEFSTIALPIAAIIGIMFILQSRRRKED